MGRQNIKEEECHTGSTMTSQQVHYPNTFMTQHVIIPAWMLRRRLTAYSEKQSLLLISFSGDILGQSSPVVTNRNRDRTFNQLLKFLTQESPSLSGEMSLKVAITLQFPDQLH